MSAELPLMLEGFGERYEPYEHLDPVAVTAFVRDVKDHLFSLRIETDTYHLYASSIMATEQHDNVAEQLEPVFVVHSKVIDSNLIARILASEIIIDYLVEQTKE